VSKLELIQCNYRISLQNLLCAKLRNVRAEQTGTFSCQVAISSAARIAHKATRHHPSERRRSQLQFPVFHSFNMVIRSNGFTVNRETSDVGDAGSFASFAHNTSVSISSFNSSFLVTYLANLICPAAATVTASSVKIPASRHTSSFQHPAKEPHFSCL